MDEWRLEESGRRLVRWGRLVGAGEPRDGEAEEVYRARVLRLARPGPVMLDEQLAEELWELPRGRPVKDRCVCGGRMVSVRARDSWTILGMRVEGADPDAELVWCDGCRSLVLDGVRYSPAEDNHG